MSKEIPMLGPCLFMLPMFLTGLPTIDHSLILTLQSDSDITV